MFNFPFNLLDKTCIRSIFLFVLLILVSSIFICYQKDYSHVILLQPLINHLYPSNFSSIYKNIVLLSCSSDSYTILYCYYLPYVALAWRRIGFEPFIFLVGSKKIFEKMPLVNLLKTDLKIKYYFINVDSSHSISTSQIIRLFGGFISYKYNTTKDLFILVADADLLPISRHRFEIDTNHTNYILAVNAYCCPNEKLSYGKYQNIHYYPMSYVGMTKYLWKKIFFPLNNCYISSHITIDMMECCLKEKMNVTIRKNVIKGTKYWDIDQKLLSLLIVQAKDLYNTYVDKRDLGNRLDSNENFLSSEFDSIHLYDDVHLPKKNEHAIFNNQTWLVLRHMFSHLFHNETIQLLSRYHYQTVANILGDNRTMKRLSINSTS
ncbi:unnamed protein product [Rotaria sp. Silwood2]|nr:unnamed protein product [Rotaria sp. Silwood2]CAF2736643.1 unnamed protein product [Rotaria sp. Silwood2]CAF3886460.1 unnamed protein product [Rotaria sp. Silwood2]CAF4181784.1 unnamed protein product [Rotaria sp. Silwood2]